MTPEPPITILHAKRRGQRYRLQTSDEQEHVVDEESALRHGLFSGREFSAEKWGVILREIGEATCYHRLLRLLSQRPHTEFEARRKLRQRDFAPDVIDKTLRRAIDLGLISDAEFARMFIEERRRKGGVGRHKIAAQLRQRGVAAKLVNETLADIIGPDSDQDEHDAAVAAAQRKWKQLHRETDKVKKRAKMYRFLAGRGFPGGLIRQVVAEVTAEGDD